MISVFKKEKESVDNMITLIKSMKDNPDEGLVNYTVPVGQIKVKLLRGSKAVDNKAIEDLNVDDNDYVVILDFAIYVPKQNVINDSPGAKLISYEEHHANCEQLIRELEDVRSRL